MPDRADHADYGAVDGFYGDGVHAAGEFAGAFGAGGDAYSGVFAGRVGSEVDVAGIALDRGVGGSP